MKMKKPKIDHIYYSCYAHIHKGKGYCELDQWVVRSVRRKRRSEFNKRHNPNKVMPIQITLVRKTPHTWVKEVGKGNLHHWAKNISQYHIKRFLLDHGLPMRVFTTPRQALIDERNHIIDCIKDSEKMRKDPKEAEYLAGITEEITESERCLKMVKTRLTKLKKVN